jgi:hypothetical protein
VLYVLLDALADRYQLVVTHPPAIA